MRKYFFLFGLLLAPLAVSAAGNQSVCTADYTPVCGSVQVQCITAPCNPVRQTFSNTCMANAGNATDITQGECATTPIVGGDSDEHGCKASAGYSWDPMMGQCIQVWEKSDTLVKWAYGSGLTKYDTVETYGYDRSITRQEAAAIFARAGENTLGLRYASYPDVCNIAYTDEKEFDASLKDDIYSACAFDMMHGLKGVFSPNRTLTRAEALVIVMRAVDGGKKDENRPIWYELYADRAHELDILSFANFKGFDTPITRGELIEWIYKATTYMKQKTTVKNDDNLLGKWDLIEFSGATVQTGMTLSFEAEKYSAKICNNISGSYTTKDGKISSGPAISTLMYCEDRMAIENAFTLDGATYGIISVRKVVGTSGPDTYLTITTASGKVFRFAK